MINDHCKTTEELKSMLGAPRLDAGLKAIRPGNTLVLWKLNRLGRDLCHLMASD